MIIIEPEEVGRIWEVSYPAVYMDGGRRNGSMKYMYCEKCDDKTSWLWDLAEMKIVGRCIRCQQVYPLDGYFYT